MKRKQLGNLTAYQIHEIRRGRLNVRLPVYDDGSEGETNVVLHLVAVGSAYEGTVNVTYYHSGRGTPVFGARVPLSTMVTLP